MNKLGFRGLFISLFVCKPNYIPVDTKHVVKIVEKGRMYSVKIVERRRM
jgi:hypothetical protein